MTNPSDPGHIPRQPAPDQPGGPYGPPPGEQPSGPYPVPPQQRQPGAPPGPRPPGPGFGPQDQQQGWAPPPRDPAQKNVIGALFDLSFDHMVTAKVAKIVYAASLVPITLVSLLLAGYGLDWIARDSGLLGFAMLVMAPFLWLIQVLVIRILMEFVINQFKISEYLRVIKDKK